MNSQKPKAGTRYRLAVDFASVEDAIRFVENLRNDGVFGEQEVGARLADALDDRQVREVLVRSISDVQDHPGALSPLPTRDTDESPTQYRDRLNHEQRAIFDARAAASL